MILRGDAIGRPRYRPAINRQRGVDVLNRFKPLPQGQHPIRRGSDCRARGCLRALGAQVGVLSYQSLDGPVAE